MLLSSPGLLQSLALGDAVPTAPKMYCIWQGKLLDKWRSAHLPCFSTIHTPWMLAYKEAYYLLEGCLSLSVFCDSEGLFLGLKR